MARPSQTKQFDEQSESDNNIGAQQDAQESAADNQATPSRTSTRIPETILPNTAPPARPTTARRDRDIDYNPPAILPNSIDHLRIRNAIQREELRTRNRELRRANLESDNFSREASEAREQILHYREELRTTTIRMERSVSCAVFVVVCVLLYVGWCWVNSAEFELQRRVLRRNLGLD